MAFKLSLMNKDPSGTVHLLAAGDATSADFQLGRKSHFEAVLGADWAAQRIIVNMGEVPYLDSSAIGWLIESQKQLRANGGALVLHSIQPAVRNVLSLLKIERVIPIAADAAAADVLLSQQSRTGKAAVAS